MKTTKTQHALLWLCMLLCITVHAITPGMSATKVKAYKPPSGSFAPVVWVQCTTPAPTASAQTFCGAGTVANLTATGTSLQWYSAETGGTALSPETALATGTYYVSQTLDGCEGPRTAVSVTVNTAVAPTVTVSSTDVQHNNINNNNYVCAGSSVTFTATVSNAGANPTYEWLIANTVQPGETGSTFTRTITNLTNVRCRVTVTPGACTTQTSVTSSPYILTSVAAPTASIAPQGATAFCEGGSVVLQSGGQIDANSTWLRNGQFYANVLPDNASITVTESGTFTLFINGYNGYSCTTTSAPVTVTVTTAPNAPVSSSQALCSPAQVSDLNATGSNL
ncbi:hypothetical protein GR160_14985, partial [Flavobacterium sp. Sd200]|nr:hypothetical protein [Flavobacterium sp. Sd200]